MQQSQTTSRNTPLNVASTTSTIESQRPFQVACESDSTVLITGPTGCGKTRLARRIHDRGARRLRPFVSVNLASLHEGTLESELFGHERGAFTGADQRRVGRLEAAAGGTVFLDEIGELPLRLQARLLEFLHSRTIVALGANRETRLDVRIIAATHRDLRRLVERGEFREDLYHRLRVVCLPMARLSERAEEFDSLVHSVLEEICRDAGRSILALTEEVAARLESHDWPGNLRELRNVLEFAVLSSTGTLIRAADLPLWFGERIGNGRDRAAQGEQAGITKPIENARFLGVAEIPMTLDHASTLSRFEREYLIRVLARFRGRVNRSAREIGMSKATLIRRMKAYDIKNEPVLAGNEDIDAMRNESSTHLQKKFSNAEEKHCAVQLS